MTLAFLLYKYFPYGGMQRDFRRFVEECRALGHECRVYCIDWQGEPLAGIDLRRVPVRALTRHRRNERFTEWVQGDLATDPVDGVIGFNKMPGLDIYFAADTCFLDTALNERGPLYRLGGRYRHFAAYERAVGLLLEGKELATERVATSVMASRVRSCNTISSPSRLITTSCSM